MFYFQIEAFNNNGIGARNANYETVNKPNYNQWKNNGSRIISLGTSSFCQKNWRTSIKRNLQNKPTNPESYA
jgi:hypothetical protein